MGDCLISDSLWWTRNTSSNLQGRAALRKEEKTVSINTNLTLTSYIYCIVSTFWWDTRAMLCQCRGVPYVCSCRLLGNRCAHGIHRSQRETNQKFSCCMGLDTMLRCWDRLLTVVSVTKFDRWQKYSGEALFEEGVGTFWETVLKTYFSKPGNVQYRWVNDTYFTDWRY